MNPSLINRGTTSGEVGEEARRRRPWADLPPDLLNVIYSKLPSDNNNEDRSQFGSVCSNWRQFHTAAGPKNPLPRTLENFNFEVGAYFGQPSLQLDSGIPLGARNLLYKSSIIYRFEDKGWLLVHYQNNNSKDYGGTDLRCFNPLLRWPSCLIDLPDLCIHKLHLPITAAFSSASSPEDGTILILHSGSYLSTLHTFRSCGRANSLWWKHRLDHRGRVSKGIEYKEGKFYVLFDTGDVLIVGIDDESNVKECRMLVATPPISLQGHETLRTVVVGESLVVNWRRRGGGGGGGGLLFRLVGVEEEAHGGDVAAAAELEEGGGGGSSYLAREDPDVEIEVDCTDEKYGCCFFVFVLAASLFMVYLFIFHNPIDD